MGYLALLENVYSKESDRNPDILLQLNFKHLEIDITLLMMMYMQVFSLSDD